jgi:four helix bundle protein
MQRSSKQVSPVLEEHFRFLLWLIAALQRFPKSQRFLLGDRIQALAQEVLEYLIEANYTRERRHHLAKANMALEKLRYFIRIAAEMEYLDHRRYEFAARSIDEIGRQVGGWLKASNVEAAR